MPQVQAFTKCNLCESPGTRSEAVDVGRVPCNVRRFKEDIFTLWRCTGCGSIHCEEDADLPLYYADYPLKKQQLGFAEQIGYGNRLRLLEGQGFRRSDRILDYGCGAGLFVQFLRGKGVSGASGWDAFVDAYSDPKILGEEYDAVVSYDVIEHDNEPRAFMASMAPLVRPGGLLVIGTPNADHVEIKRKGDPSLHPPYHRHILSERVLLSLGKDAGLEPIQIRRRSFYDSLVPTVNSRFMFQYVRKSGGLLDVVVESPGPAPVFKNPELILYALCGNFMPAHDYIQVVFRKKA